MVCIHGTVGYSEGTGRVQEEEEEGGGGRRRRKVKGEEGRGRRR